MIGWVSYIGGRLAGVEEEEEGGSELGSRWS